MKHLSARIDKQIIAFFILISFYSFFRGTTYANLILALVILLTTYSTIKLVSFKRKNHFKNPFSGKKFFWIFFLIYCLFLTSGFIRLIGNYEYDQTTIIGKFFLFSSIIFLSISISIRNLKSPQKIVFSMMIGIATVNLLNILGISIGIENQTILNSYTREIESVFSPTGYRLLFPFVDSGQFYSFIAGIGIIGSIFLWNNKSRIEKILMAITFLSSLFIILGHGSRMAFFLLIPITTLGFNFLWIKANRFISHAIIIIILILPLTIYNNTAGIIIQSITQSIGLEISKYNNDLITFSNRDKIFGSVIDAIPLMAPSNILFGYGNYGQKSSGISNEYSDLFSFSYTDTDIIPLHNTLMQILIDYGVIGIFAFLLLLQLSLRKIDNNRKAPTLMLIYLLLGSTTEANLTYYSILTYFIFLLLLLTTSGNESFH